MIILEKMIKNELENANKKFNQFQSRHEAYAIMKEEVEELMDEIYEITQLLNDFWEICKKTKSNENKEEVKQLLGSINFTIERAFKELIQVGAMVEKTKILEEGVKN